MKKALKLTMILTLAGTLFVNYPANSQTTNDAATGATTTEDYDDNEEGTDWGWIGLLGLIGLYGLKGKKDHDHRGTTTTSNPLSNR